MYLPERALQDLPSHHLAQVEITFETSLEPLKPHRDHPSVNYKGTVLWEDNIPGDISYEDLYEDGRDERMCQDWQNFFEKEPAEYVEILSYRILSVEPPPEAVTNEQA
jgi:hypothetical protein